MHSNIQLLSLPFPMQLWLLFVVWTFSKVWDSRKAYGITFSVEFSNEVVSLNYFFDFYSSFWGCGVSSKNFLNSLHGICAKDFEFSTVSGVQRMALLTIFTPQFLNFRMLLEGNCCFIFYNPYLMKTRSMQDIANEYCLFGFLPDWLIFCCEARKPLIRFHWAWRQLAWTRRAYMFLRATCDWFCRMKWTHFKNNKRLGLIGVHTKIYFA